MNLTKLVPYALLLASSAAVAQAPASKPTSTAPTVEMAFREECDSLAKGVLDGYLAARRNQAMPQGEAAQAGFALPDGTDIASQAARIKRECLKQLAGSSEPAWAAVEVIAQARVLRAAAVRCISSGFTYEAETSEAELELAGCHRPEYPGLPAVVGGAPWALKQAEAAEGLTLEVIGRLTGANSGAICTQINDFRKLKEDPSCQVRDSYSLVTSRFVLEQAKSQEDIVNDMMRKMVEDYKRRQSSEKPSPSVMAPTTSVESSNPQAVPVSVPAPKD